MNPLPLAFAMMRRNAVVCGAFVVLIALAVGVGAAITSQERALRHGSARAADRFDLVVAAPGSVTDLLLKVVYLRPGSVELLQGEPLHRLMSESRAEFVAPIGFGDSVNGDPVVGTIPALVEHLAAGKLEGHMFEHVLDAVVGTASPLRIGDTFQPTHGHGPEAQAEDYHPQKLTVVGRLPPTGSPWDRAILVPIEHVWQVHGLADGHGGAASAHAEDLIAGEEAHEAETADAHAPDEREAEAQAHEEQAGEAHGEEEHAGEEDHEHGEAHDVRIGPPFDLATMPGIPAAVVKPRTLAEAYGLRNTWRTTETTAFFPAEVLVQLYELLGDARLVMSALAIATQLLLIAAILAGILILMRLYRQRFAVLRALGASRGYIFAVVWCFSFGLIALGSALGLAVAAGMSGLVSAVFEQASGIALDAQIGTTELALALSIAALGGLAALAPAALLYRQPVAAALRGA
jgi:putative ABC transport system permease protein